MARIRTIKPELPQSESMGRVSRDARLCFIMLWTIADDAGRLRGNSRMLASLLFPYDDDAKDLMPGWLGELSDEGCIVVYRHGSDSYVQICNWLIHQKIDKPSQSKIPPHNDDSVIPREDSRILPVGPKDQGRDQGSEDQGAKEGNAPATPTRQSKKSTKTAIPENFTVSDRVKDWAKEHGHSDKRVSANFAKLTLYAKREGKTYADWDAALMEAIRENWAKVPDGQQLSRHGGFSDRNYHAGADKDGKF